MLTRTRWLRAAGIVLLVPTLAAAQATPAPDKVAASGGVEVREKVVTQVYDVSDIIYGMRNYPFSSALVPPALTESNSSSGGAAGEAVDSSAALRCPNSRTSAPRLAAKRSTSSPSC